MASRRKKVYMVRRLDTFGGMSIRANTHDEAARKAARYRTMKDASEFEVREFCGGPGTSTPIMVKS